MSLDLGLVAALLKEGRPAVRRALQSGMKSSMLDGDGKKAYEFLVDHVKNYGDVPSIESVQGKTGVLVSPVPEPTEFWLKEISNRTHYQLLQSGVEEIVKALKKVDLSAAEAARIQLDKAIRESRFGTTKIESLLSLGDEVIKYYDDMKGGKRGILTPWPSVNDATLGLWPEDLVLFVARVGIGKTWTSVILAGHAWEQEITTPSGEKRRVKVLYCTTEMAKFKIAMRYYAYKLKIPYKDFRSGMLGDFAEAQMKEGIKKMMNDPNFLIVGGDFDFSMEAFDAAIDEAQPDLVVLDGAYLLKTEGDSRTDKAANTFNDLKRICKRRQCPMIVTMQFNREVKANIASSVRTESIALTDVASWNADVIYGLIQTEEMKEKAEMDLKDLKIREGSGGECKLHWDFVGMDFSEIPKDQYDSSSFDYAAQEKAKGGSSEVAPF